MANIFQRIGAGLMKVVRAVLRLQDPAVRAKVLDTAETVNSLIEYALPAAELVSRLTADTNDDRIVAALSALNRSASGILSVEDKGVRDGLLLELAAELTRQAISEAIERFGVITINGVQIRIPSEIANSAIRAAAGYAYAVIVKPAD